MMTMIITGMTNLVAFISILAISEAFIAIGSGREAAICKSSLSSHKNNEDFSFQHDHDDRDVMVARRSFLSSTLGIALLGAALPSSAAETKALSEEYRQGTAALADMDEMAPVPKEAYQKLPSGVIYADMRPGTGSETVATGSRVNLQWVLRRSNGYFVDSSEVSGSVPFIFTVGDGTAIKGIDEGVIGMKPGGVRRILIPPRLAYVDGLEDGKPGPLPAGFGPRQQMRRIQTVRKDVPGEYVFLEVQATRIR